MYPAQNLTEAHLHSNPRIKQRKEKEQKRKLNENQNAGTREWHGVLTEAH
jgi:hypothetical protein